MCCVRACVCCVRACMRACVRACVRACACVYKHGAVFDANLHLRSPWCDTWISRGPLCTHAQARKAGYILMHLPENTMVPINTAQSKQQAARIFIIQNHHGVACAWMRYVITCLSPYHFIQFLGMQDVPLCLLSHVDNGSPRQRETLICERKAGFNENTAMRHRRIG